MPQLGAYERAMVPRSALLAMFALILLAACAGTPPASPSAAEETATTSASASASPTEQTTEDPTGGPTIAPGTDLAALLPTSVAGMELAVGSYEGEEAGRLMTEHMGGSAGSIATVLGVDVTELEAAAAATLDANPFGEGGGHVVFAIRFPGADSSAITDAVVPVAGGMDWMSGMTELTEGTVGGRDVSILETSAATHYFYAIDDVIFVVRTPDRLVAEDALSQLP